MNTVYEKTKTGNWLSLALLINDRSALIPYSKTQWHIPTIRVVSEKNIESR